MSWVVGAMEGGGEGGAGGGGGGGGAGLGWGAVYLLPAPRNDEFLTKVSQINFSSFCSLSKHLRVNNLYRSLYLARTAPWTP